MARYYKTIHAYQLAYSFVLEVYKYTNSFPKEEKNNITSQIRRAAVSVPLNIAEGSAKESTREFVRYLNIAYGSAKEVEVLLDLCRDLKYFNLKEYDLLKNKLEEVNGTLFLFIGSVEKRIDNKKHQFFKKFEKK